MQSIEVNPNIVSIRMGEPSEGPVRVVVERLELVSQGAPQLLDLTPAVADVVSRSLIRHGQVLIFCTHTTASLVLNEDEPLLHQDVADFLEALASSQASYRHDDFSIRTHNLVPDHGRNAHAHIKQMLLGSSQILPIVNGALALGGWQRLFLLEMDRPKPRHLVVQVLGV
ncbi:MAG: secondary thiamine-phosphate synthase enzyme YjbQ [Candidatus Xenobia bacterium]